MAIEDNVINQLKVLSKQEKVRFISACMHRVISLYKYFDDEEDISQVIPEVAKGEGYSLLLSILEFIDYSLQNASEEEIRNQIKKCDPLIIDTDIFGNSINAYVAQLIAQSISFILEFYIENNDKKINYCVDNMLEILNQLRSDRFYKSINPNGSNAELREYLNNIFSEELIIEESIISAIKTKDENSLEHIISTTMVGK